MIPLSTLSEAAEKLEDAFDALKVARTLLGDHWTAKSHCAEALRDILNARTGIAGEIRGREGLGETA